MHSYPLTTTHRQTRSEGLTRLVWAPSGTGHQAFAEAPYQDEFDEWLACIVCYAFSLPPTPFIKQVNRATADTAQEAALDEGMAPLMGWVKRLADHVIQDRLGEGDLEFAWAEERATDPAEQAKILDTYVRDGIYAINEARGLLGLDPVPGGDRPMIYRTQGAVPLTVPAAAVKAAHTVNLRKYNSDEPRVPAGSPAGGQWTSEGGEGEVEVAAGGTKCDGFAGGCRSGGSYGTSPLYTINGRNLCRDCAVKYLGLENLPAGAQTKTLEDYYIDSE